MENNFFKIIFDVLKKQDFDSFIFNYYTWWPLKIWAVARAINTWRIIFHENKASPLWKGETWRLLNPADLLLLFEPFRITRMPQKVVQVRINTKCTFHVFSQHTAGRTLRLDSCRSLGTAGVTSFTTFILQKFQFICISVMFGLINPQLGAFLH